MADDHTIEDLEVSKVIVDTGATESVAGVRAMARVLDAHQMPYDIDLFDRPRFRFGNGEHQRAISKISLSTFSFGKLSFYLLDGKAENTPLLLCSRDMRKRKAVISYHAQHLVHTSPLTGQWWWRTPDHGPEGAPDSIEDAVDALQQQSRHPMATRR